MRCVALGRKNYLFVGSEGGGKSAAIAYTLIETAKLNGVNPQAWLTDILGRIADHKITRLDELMPWRYAASAAELATIRQRQSIVTGRTLFREIPQALNGEIGKWRDKSEEMIEPHMWRRRSAMANSGVRSGASEYLARFRIPSDVT